jgi:hypothetical protein
MRILHLLAASAAVGALAVPATAQQPYPYAQPAPQPYPGQPGYGYQQPGYAQPYGTNVVEQIVNQLLGNNNTYSVSDRSAVSRCATAAVAQAERQYRPGYNGYGNRYGYNQPANPHYGYNNAYSQMRVTAITNVDRRSNRSLRVQGLIDTGAAATGYGTAYGNRYADPRYAQAADLSFRCNVDYRGAVSGLKLSRYNARYGR